MGDSAGATAGQIRKIGPDQVKVTDSELVIEAKYPMPDWEVRDLNPIPIYFEERKWFLVESRKGAPPFRVRYLLHPWPQGNFSNAKSFHTYDAETVAERDAHHRSGNTDEIVRACLLPFYPLLGLTWSGVQQRLVRFGFVPHTISGVSAFTVFALGFAQACFSVIMINATIRTGKMMIGGLICAVTGATELHLGPIRIPIGIFDGLLLLALLLDAAMRYSHYLRDDQWAGGFLEWALPKRWRKHEE